MTFGGGIRGWSLEEKEKERKKKRKEGRRKKERKKKRKEKKKSRLKYVFEKLKNPLRIHEASPPAPKEAKPIRTKIRDRRGSPRGCLGLRSKIFILPFEPLAILPAGAASF